jgi:outer membrane receptor protein involved in Fe transport
MKIKRSLNQSTFFVSALALTALSTAIAQEVQGPTEEILVIGNSENFANTSTDTSMLRQQAPITSVLAVIDNLPGVSIQEGDTYGFDDWSTAISMRGFQSNLDEQQIGITIDGMPNGNSNYGGGAKANRFIDSMNLGGVLVSQGTADIASRSNEALGGTLDFQTTDPLDQSLVSASLSQAEFDGSRFYARYDTGSILGGDTRAWLSVSHQEATDWINGSAENVRDHFAAKLVSAVGGNSELTAYFSYDDTHEDNYQRLFSPADFADNPEWDQLTDQWIGIPYIDQLYRKGWSTLRENTFAYLTLDSSLGDDFNITVGGYYHDNAGRGDWVPPYLVDVVDDAGGAETEFLGGSTVLGGASLGQIFFVDPTGVALAPTAGCASTIGFPYGGAGPQYDPACYPADAIPVQSYRHTHYGKERKGLLFDFDWAMDLGGDRMNTLRGGMWYEDYDRAEWRDWHKIIDTRVGFEFAGGGDAPERDTGYWTQYDRQYPVETMKWYLEDSIDLGAVTLTLGVKQFLVDLERKDNFGDTTNVSVDSDSDLLPSAGAVFRTPVDGLELFAGYAENFKALSDDLLERPSSDFSNLEPETSENIDLGLRYFGDDIAVSVTYYDVSFENRIIFLDNQAAAGPNYLIGTNGSYFNAGGIESNGLEVSANLRVGETWSVYLSYTNNDSTYLGSGAPGIDALTSPGNAVVGMPDDMFVVSFDYQSGPLRAGLTNKLTGDRYVDFANTWQVGSYSISDLYVGVDGEALSNALENFDFRLTINNLLDEDYLGGISGQGAWIGAPRTAAFTVTARFD